MKAVLDTNVLVSAFINELGASHRLLRLVDRAAFQLVTSEPLLTELQEVLDRPRLKRRYRFDDAEVKPFLAGLRTKAEVIPSSRRIDALRRDPDDNRVLEAAVEGGAEYVVSGDRDLLDMGSFENISIVSPARFVAILQASDT